MPLMLVRKNSKAESITADSTFLVPRILQPLFFLFPSLNEDDTFKVLPYFWLLEDNVTLRVNRDHVPYDIWV